MGFIRPGKYNGFTVEEHPGDGTRVIANGKTTVFNANGVEIEDEAPAKPQPERKAAAVEKDWTGDVRSR